MAGRGMQRSWARIGATIAIGIVSIAGCSGGAGGSPSASVTPTPSAQPPAASSPASTPTVSPTFGLASCDGKPELIEPAPPDPSIPSLPIAATIDLPSAGDAFSVGSAGGSIWVTDGIGGFVHRIDPETRAVLASIAVGETGDMYLAATDDAIWMTGMRNWLVASIDLASNALGDPLDGGRGPLGVAIGPNGPLVVSFEDQTLVEIDPVTGKQQRSLALDPDRIAPPDAGPTDVEVIGSTAWVLGHRGRMVLGVDLESFSITAQHCVDLPTPERMTQADGALWISSSLESTVARLDPATGLVDGRVRLPEPAFDDKSFIWELSVDDAGDVWVAAHSFVARIDGERLEVTAWVDLRPLAPAGGVDGAFDVRVVDGRAWISFSAGADSRLVIVEIPE